MAACPDRGAGNNPKLFFFFTVGNMGVMICLGQGGLRSLSASGVFDSVGLSVCVSVCLLVLHIIITFTITCFLLRILYTFLHRFISLRMERTWA